MALVGGQPDYRAVVPRDGRGVVHLEAMGGGGCETEREEEEDEEEVLHRATREVGGTNPECRLCWSRKIANQDTIQSPGTKCNPQGDIPLGIQPVLLSLSVVHRGKDFMWWASQSIAEKTCVI